MRSPEQVPHRDPQPPFATDEEVQRLRDLWRPGIQAEWQPLGWPDPGTRQPCYRDEDFDPSQYSLWMDQPMYVIPPDIAKPLRAIVDEEVDGPFFVESYRDWQDEVLHGGRRFMQRFLWGNRVINGGGVNDYSRGDADANFDHTGKPTGFLAQGLDKDVRVEVSAPVLERRIAYKEADVPIFHHEADGIVGSARERQYREGPLGWTIPFNHVQPRHMAFSILRAKNHLIEVSWYNYPRERLSMHFMYPQMSKLGETLLSEMLAELEPIIPEGTDYEELYDYQQRAEEDFLSQGKWRDTQEDRDRHQKEYDKEYREWVSRKPRIRNW